MTSLLKYLKPYRVPVLLVLLMTLASTMMELFLPTLMADIVDVGIVNGDLPFIWKTGGLMAICSALAAVSTIIVSYFSNRVSVGFAKDIRRAIFVRVENFSLQEFDDIGTASLITRTTNDVKQLQDVVNMILRVMTRAPLMLAGGIVLAVSRDAVLSLIFLVALPILVGGIYFISRKAIPLFGLLQLRTDRLNLLLREVLNGIRVVRTFNRVEYEKQRFQEANVEYRDMGIRVGKIMSVVFPIMMITMSFTNVAIVWFGAIRIDQGMMQVGNLMAFLQYAMMILISLIMMSMALIAIPRAEASAKRINEVLLVQSSEQAGEKNRREIELKDTGYGDTDVDALKGASAQMSGTGYIEFKDVAFYYRGAEKAAIEHISFTAKPGQTTAIIGSTGSGKTTLVQLILRFYETNRGKILIGGKDIRDMNLEELRKKIAYVPQKSTLFSGTIAENIRFGKEDATEDEIVDALETAQALEFVREKEEGIHAALSQGGGNLSGGQKQRLSIARALVRKPQIYIFDDSFSALDYKTDARLRRALSRYTENATVITVTQRVSTVIDAEQIIVLDDGKIVGIGNHQCLLDTCQIYREIVISQQLEEESA